MTQKNHHTKITRNQLQKQQHHLVKLLLSLLVVSSGHIISISQRSTTTTSTAAAMAASGLASAATAVEAMAAGATPSTTQETAAPMYITIGPQCCGKSTWINRNIIASSSSSSSSKSQQQQQQQQKQQQIVDICLDDQPGVYVKVDTDVWLSAVAATATSTTTTTTTTTEQQQQQPQNFGSNDGGSRGVPSSSTVKARSDADVDAGADAFEAGQQSSFFFLSQKLYGKTMLERINDDNNIELTLILQRLRNDIDKSEFRRRLTSFYQQKQQQQQQQQQQWQQQQQHGERRKHRTTMSTIDYRTHCQTLIQVVDDFLAADGFNRSDGTVVPPPPVTVDLFVLEALFQPPPNEGPPTVAAASTGNSHHQSQSSPRNFSDNIKNNNKTMSAIDRAHEQLRSVPSHVPVAWGNTNSKPRDYEVALDIASQMNRPVEFVLCHPSNNNDIDHSHNYGDDNNCIKKRSGCDDDDDDDNGMMKTIPWVSLEELLRRNLQRLVNTGRYIPSFAIDDCRRRVASMIVPNIDEGNNNNNYHHNGNNKNGIDVDRRRFLVSQASSRSHEYILKDNGLIEKRPLLLHHQGREWNHRGGRRYGDGRGGGGRNRGRNSGWGRGNRNDGRRNGFSAAGSPASARATSDRNGNPGNASYYRSNSNDNSSGRPRHGGGGRGGRGERTRGTTHVGQNENDGGGGGGGRGYRQYDTRRRQDETSGGRLGRGNRSDRGNSYPGSHTG